MYTVGLTGGIASGKTQVSTLFAAHDIDIIDTDVIARDLVAPNSPHLTEIISRFGRGFLREEGQLDRSKVRELIFSDPEAKRWLETLLHPAIRAACHAAIAACSSPYCIVVVPLLVESGLQHYSFLNRIAVVDCPETLQLHRLMSRDNLSLAQAKAIIEAQASRDERLDVAQDIILNEGDIQTLTEQVDVLHQKYLSLSQNSTLLL